MRAKSIVALIALALTAAPASADFIQNHFDGVFPDGDTYSALFTIHDTATPNVFLATLTNTSPNDGIGPGPLIDRLAFNTTAVFGTDFTIQNVSPLWSVVAGDAAGPPNTQFDVFMQRTTPGTRLAIGESLTFNIVGINPINFFTFLDAEQDTGAGIGGGTDIGQKAVRFQQLGEGGGGSDLLADDWNPKTPISEVPEPSVLVVLGSAILGMASFIRRRDEA